MENMPFRRITSLLLTNSLFQRSDNKELKSADSNILSMDMTRSEEHIPEWFNSAMNEKVGQILNQKCCLTYFDIKAHYIMGRDHMLLCLQIYYATTNSLDK